MNITNRQILFVLTALGFASLGGSYLAHLNGGEVNLIAWADGALQNFGTEMFGAVVTFFLLEMIVETRKKREEEAFQNAPISVILKSGLDEIRLPVTIRRADLTRTEVYGRIQTLNPRHRISLSALNHQEFYQRLNEIFVGKGGNALVITVTDEELAKFR